VVDDVSEGHTKRKDFRQFRGSGRRSSAGLAIGMGFAIARDAIARGLAAIGVTPNMLTAAGLVVTCGAGVCLAIGAGHAPTWEHPPILVPQSHWVLVAAVVLFLASALDMLDGALARVGKMQTRFGAVFDSTIDRCSDMALFLGCAVYFAARGNVTYVVLSILALSSSVLISYIKARAENLVEDCGAAYWQRGERVAAILIAAFAGHIPAALWELGILQWFTVWRRIRYARGLLTGDGRPWEPTGRLRSVLMWRHPRGSIGYDVVTLTNIAFLIVGPWLWPFFYGTTDPLGQWLRGVTG